MCNDGRMEVENGTQAIRGESGRTGEPLKPARVTPDGAEHAVAMDLPRVSGVAATIIAIVVLLLLGGLFVLGWRPHARGLANANAQAQAAVEAKPVVDVIAARLSSRDDVLLLPADVRPNQVTDLRARASGYLKTLPQGIDIGSRVESGRVIAEISAPEIDAELAQAQATLQQTKAATLVAEQQAALSRSTLARYEAAQKGRAVAEQEVEERRTQVSVGESMLEQARANVIAAEAAVHRLSELQSFQAIRAPFTGVLTARGYDAGALIKGDDSSTRALFRLEQTDVLRASVNVPQSEVPNVRLGQEAELLVRDIPDRTFAGKVARTAASLNSGTRTMPIEVDVPNPENLLLPGMYGQIRFHLKRARQTLFVPTSALVYGPDGVRVVVVRDGVSRYQPVTLGRDLGMEAEVDMGVSAIDQIVNNPGDLKDGAAVTVRAGTKSNSKE